MDPTANTHPGTCFNCCTHVPAGVGRLMTAGGRQVHIHASGQCPPVVWIMETGEIQEGGYIAGVYTDRELARGDFYLMATQMCDRFGERAPDLAESSDPGRLRVEVHCDWLTLTAWPVTTATAIPAAPPQPGRGPDLFTSTSIVARRARAIDPDLRP
jgi:hypothetical protein